MMSPFKITSDIPPPARMPHEVRSVARRGRPMEYPWAEMSPGDSVFLPGKIAAPSSSIRGWCKANPGQKFVSKKEEGGVRVWRVA